MSRDSPLSERNDPAKVIIDAGFVHHRKIVAVLGPAGAQALNARVANIPSHLPESLKKLQTDQLYGRVLVESCSRSHVPGFLEFLAEPIEGGLVSSVESIARTAKIATADRVTTKVRLRGNSEYTVRLDYSTRHIVADTTRAMLSGGAEIAIVATLGRREGNTLIFEPLLMGTPTIAHAKLGHEMWLHQTYGQLFVEDIDEFAHVSDQPDPKDSTIMREISERAFKACLADLLGEEAPRDWGGEQSDLYTAHVHVEGERMEAAFLLKGPARFEPMKLNSLGKKNDQIVRLAQEPAKLLVVQHCHTITPPVRVTLRAFTIQPGTLERRYCLIDGRDSLRMLLAYGKLDEALALSHA